MAKTAILFGLLLIGLGIVGYAGSGLKSELPAADETAVGEIAPAAASGGPAAKKSVTALIPAFFGIVLLCSGTLGLKESWRKHALHVAAAAGLLGLLAGGGRGVMGLGKFFAGDPSLNHRSFTFVWLMTVLCSVFLLLCIRSFIAARRDKLVEKTAG